MVIENKITESQEASGKDEWQKSGKVTELIFHISQLTAISSRTHRRGELQITVLSTAAGWCSLLSSKGLHSPTGTVIVMHAECACLTPLLHLDGACISTAVLLAVAAHCSCDWKWIPAKTSTLQLSEKLCFSASGNIVKGDPNTLYLLI